MDVGTIVTYGRYYCVVKSLTDDPNIVKCDVLTNSDDIKNGVIENRWVNRMTMLVHDLTVVEEV